MTPADAGIRVKVECDEGTVDALAVHLELRGYRYDEDYTTLYGNGWAVVGVQLQGPRLPGVMAEAGRYLLAPTVPMGTRVRLLQDTAEGWDEEYGTVNGRSGEDEWVVTLDEKYRQGPGDDGLREVTLDQIELLVAHPDAP